MEIKDCMQEIPPFCKGGLRGIFLHYDPKNLLRYRIQL